MEHSNGATTRTSTRACPSAVPRPAPLGCRSRSLTGKRFQKIGWDIYLDCGVKITPQIRSRAALKLAPPGSRISHHTAAQLWNAQVPRRPDHPFTMPSADGRLVRKGIKSHYYDSHIAHDHRSQWSTGLDTRTDPAGSGVVGHAARRSGRRPRRHDQGQAHLARGTDQGRRGLYGARSRLALRAAHLARAGVDSLDGDAAAAAHRPRRPARAARQPDRPRMRRAVAASLRPGL